MDELASLDGAVTPLADARIAVTDEGLLRGDGAFEVAKLYAGRPFGLEEHYARLERSCAGLRLAYDADALRAEVDALIAAAGPVDALLRIVLTRGGRRIAMVQALPPHPDAVRLGTITFAPTRVLDGLKTLSYAGNMLAGRVAKENGYDEGLFVTPHGRVLEGPTSSFFWARGGVLRTPPLEERILDSITRRHVLEVCEVEESPCTLEDLRGAEEAFLASSVREVMPVAAVDEVELPEVPGPLTRAAREALSERIRTALSAAPVA